MAAAISVHCFLSWAPLSRILVEGKAKEEEEAYLLSDKTAQAFLKLF